MVALHHILIATGKTLSRCCAIHRRDDLAIAPANDTRRLISQSDRPAALLGSKTRTIESDLGPGRALGGADAINVRCWHSERKRIAPCAALVHSSITGGRSRGYCRCNLSVTPVHNLCGTATDHDHTAVTLRGAKVGTAQDYLRPGCPVIDAEAAQNGYINRERERVAPSTLVHGNIRNCRRS